MTDPVFVPVEVQDDVLTAETGTATPDQLGHYDDNADEGVTADDAD